MYTNAPQDQPAKIAGFVIACAIAFPLFVTPILMPIIKAL